ncbi:LLM class flavin-dependent oxidoreductase [Streptomyces triticirhizae]|uniref:LLM class flavin-dependent oxidoreductase n=1 Tax=Streptomyces triticirhizae TaxID=2483353 RepID=A0A3M2LMF6_9ACTN|nr:LLM class flavin-dependent oxidoreductase [Streptomyces triticirhizae]RMI38644.1 LLM class flavin-dependent oxidoreductase [Streptomyces triticirhizae]
MDFGLFYFADDRPVEGDRYRLLLDTATFADRNGFSAVWTPERHFHAFGGQYPNPAVTGAALATVTENVAIRAGSVVAPLHNPLRIAEEWSVVDNLSGGRAGVSFASGWHAVDFALRPENYARRKEILSETTETVRRLWRGEAVAFPDGTGKDVGLTIHPAPVQAELPVWLTSAGSVDTFREAGRLGAGILTHLLGQDLDDLGQKIAAYREAFTASGAPDAGAVAGGGHVALMLHTFVGADREEVRELVRRPFSAYLRSSVALLARTMGTVMSPADLERMRPEDLDFLISRSFDRYFDTGGMFGTVDDCLKTAARLEEIGVDEVACLIDFGVAHDQVLDGLTRLDEVRRGFA